MDTVERSPVRFWFELMHRYANHLPKSEASHPEVLAAVTLGVVLQPAVAAVYGNPRCPMVDNADMVARAVCRVLYLNAPEAEPSAVAVASHN